MNYLAEVFQISRYTFLEENKFQRKNINKKSLAQPGVQMDKHSHLVPLMVQFHSEQDHSTKKYEHL